MRPDDEVPVNRYFTNATLRAVDVVFLGDIVSNYVAEGFPDAGNAGVAAATVGGTQSGDAIVDALDVVPAGDIHIDMEYFFFKVWKGFEHYAFGMLEIEEIEGFSEVIQLYLWLVLPIGKNNLVG